MNNIPNLIELGDLNIELNINGSVCVFMEDSGSGKTYLFECLKQWCVLSGKKIKVFDYVEQPKNCEEVMQNCDSTDVIIFDNADLYCTYSMIKVAEQAGVDVFVSAKRKCKTGMYELYICKYTPGKIEVRSVSRW